MTDYLALARGSGDASTHEPFGSPAEAQHLRAAHAYATVALAEALTSIAHPAQPPIEPSEAMFGESSLTTLDRIEAQAEVLAAARHVRALYDEAAVRQSGDWWHAIGTLIGAIDAMDVADRIGGAL